MIKIATKTINIVFGIFYGCNKLILGFFKITFLGRRFMRIALAKKKKNNNKNRNFLIFKQFLKPIITIKIIKASIKPKILIKKGE